MAAAVFPSPPPCAYAQVFFPPAALYPRGRPFCASPALHTVQVRVGVRAGVEPLLPAEHADAHHVALLGKQAQVPVHRAEAQVGIVRLELLIQLLRGGVGGRRGEGFEDDLPLFAVFACGHRSTSLQISNKNYY